MNNHTKATFHATTLSFAKKATIGTSGAEPNSTRSESWGTPEGYVS